MVQWAKCLLCKCENLSTDPYHAHKKLSSMPICSLCWKETGGSLELTGYLNCPIGQACLQSYQFPKIRQERDGSMVQSTYCSFREPEFSSEFLPQAAPGNQEPLVSTDTCSYMHSPHIIKIIFLQKKIQSDTGRHTATTSNSTHRDTHPQIHMRTQAFNTCIPNKQVELAELKMRQHRYPGIPSISFLTCSGYNHSPYKLLQGCPSHEITS